MSKRDRRLRRLGAPRKLRDVTPGRSRWRYRGRDYIVARGAYMLGAEWAGIYDAAPDHDGIQLPRQRASYDPAATTVAEQLRRIR